MAKKLICLFLSNGTIIENNKKYKKQSNGIAKKFLSPQAIQFYIDIVSVIVAYNVYFFIKYISGWFYNVVEPSFVLYSIPMLVLLAYWLLLFWVNGLYRDWYIRSPFDEFFAVLRVTLFGSFVLFFLVFLDSGDRQPRLIFVIYFAIITLSVGVGRIFARQLQKQLRKEKNYILHAMLIGKIASMKEFARKIQLSPAWGYQVIGGVQLDNNDIQEGNYYHADVKIFGQLDNLKKILKQELPDEVLITRATKNRSTLMDIVNTCIGYGIKVKIVPDLYDIFTGSVRTFPIYGIPLIEVHTQLLKPWESAIKRIIDVVVSVLVLIIGLPIWVLLAIIIKLESEGSIFYTQLRVGKDGKEFKIYKFRSMIKDAQKKGGVWTAINDSRVTRFGRFLRKSHLDEVPQFINVLKGEMSIVGPRPEQPVIVDKYIKLVPYYQRRLAIRPGITGWWQVKYKQHEESIEEIENRLKDDFYYIENMSLQLDLEIMVRTVFLMLKGHGQT